MKTDIIEFEKELKKLNSHLSIKPNPKDDTMAGVYYMGNYMFACPNGYIFDEPMSSHVNSVGMRHRSKKEILAMVKGTMLKIKTDSDHADALMGVGKYSDKNLK